MRNRLLLPGIVLVALMHSAGNVSGAEPGEKLPALKGNAGQGQTLFNGKGICHYCHGVDGVLDKKPSLKPDTAAAIAKLSAGAPDLRNRAGLTLKDNKARFRAIREGHPGSGMLPDTTLSDQDITDLLAYLASLRQSQTTPGKSPY
ncbi:MAG: cytochrome c [Nitrospira sp.]|nr:cytochrome c [Nitrospira sp.]